MRTRTIRSGLLIAVILTVALIPAAGRPVTSFGTYKCVAFGGFRSPGSQPSGAPLQWTFNAQGSCITTTGFYSVRVLGSEWIGSFPTIPGPPPTTPPATDYRVSTTVSHATLGSRTFFQAWYMPSLLSPSVFPIRINKATPVSKVIIVGGQTGVGAGDHFPGLCGGAMCAQFVFTFGWDELPIDIPPSLE